MLLPFCMHMIKLQVAHILVHPFDPAQVYTANVLACRLQRSLALTKRKQAAATNHGTKHSGLNHLRQDHGRSYPTTRPIHDHSHDRTCVCANAAPEYTGTLQHQRYEAHTHVNCICLHVLLTADSKNSSCQTETYVAFIGNRIPSRSTLPCQPNTLSVNLMKPMTPITPDNTDRHSCWYSSPNCTVTGYRAYIMNTNWLDFHRLLSSPTSADCCRCKTTDTASGSCNRAQSCTTPARAAAVATVPAPPATAASSQSCHPGASATT